MADASRGSARSTGGSMLKAEPGDGVQPLQSAATKAAASAQRRESDLVLIDVALLLDVRFPGALQLLGVELSVPPQSSSLFLFLDDVRLLLEQLANHSGEIGFVGFRHAGANYTLGSSAGLLGSFFLSN